MKITAGAPALLRSRSWALPYVYRPEGWAPTGELGFSQVAGNTVKEEKET